MTISLTSTGALSQGTVTITPAYGSGVVAGRLAILTVVSGHPSESIPQTPSGWSQIDTLSGGGGVFGSGTGPRRITWFARVLLGSDAAPTTAIPTATGSVIAGRITILQRTAGTGWRWGSSTGADITSGTAFSDTGSNPLSWASGDFALLGYGLPVSTASATAEAIAAVGITFGTITEQADDQITSGNAGRLVLATGLATAGSATVDPTVTATLAVASTGVVGVIRVREASAALAATAQAVFPPRVLCALTGMLAENIVTASIYRVLGTARTPVRAATGITVTGTDALLRVDAEQPFGVATSYGATLVDINGDTWTVTSSAITSTVANHVISDATQGIGVAVSLEAWPDKARDRGATVFNVGGRMVVVTKNRSGATSTVTLRTVTAGDHDAVEQLLDTATEGVILLRAQTTDYRVDGWFVVTADAERPNWIDDYCWWDLTVVESEAWPDTLEAAGFTLQDIANNYTSLLDISTANTTLLALALRSF